MVTAKILDFASLPQLKPRDGGQGMRRGEWGLWENRMKALRYVRIEREPK